MARGLGPPVLNHHIPALDEEDLAHRRHRTAAPAVIHGPWDHRLRVCHLGASIRGRFHLTANTRVKPFNTADA